MQAGEQLVGRDVERGEKPKQCAEPDLAFAPFDPADLNGGEAAAVGEVLLGPARGRATKRPVGVTIRCCSVAAAWAIQTYTIMWTCPSLSRVGAVELTWEAGTFVTPNRTHWLSVQVWIQRAAARIPVGPLSDVGGCANAAWNPQGTSGEKFAAQASELAARLAEIKTAWRALVT